MVLKKITGLMPNVFNQVFPDIKLRYYSVKPVISVRHYLKYPATPIQSGCEVEWKVSLLVLSCEGKKYPLQC